MRHERQVELLQRVADAGPRMAGLFGASSRVNPASAYTDPERFAQEQELLFRAGPTFLGLSAQCREPGAFLAASIAGIPVVVIRQDDGSVRGFVNACRHRAAPLMAEGGGTVGPRFACGYHSWTYSRAGELVARPLSDGAFDDISLNCDLHQIAVAEKYGLISPHTFRK